MSLILIPIDYSPPWVNNALKPMALRVYKVNLVCNCHPFVRAAFLRLFINLDVFVLITVEDEKENVSHRRLLFIK